MTGQEWPSAARAVLTELTDGLSEVLGVHLVGVYAFGSLVTGDFDRDISDLDVLAVLESDLTDESFARARPAARRSPCRTSAVD